MTWLGRAQRALAGMGVGKVTANLEDDAGALKLQTDFGRHIGLRGQVPLLQQFGVTSRPPNGADVLVLFPDGDTTNAVVVATGSQAKRLRGLAEGDVAIHDDRGAYLWFTENGPVLDGGGKPLTIQNCSEVTIKGVATVNVDGAETLNVQASEGINFDTPQLTVTGDVIAPDIP